MKKILLGLLALSSLSFAEGNYINFKVGKDVASEYKSFSDADGKLLNDKTKKDGFSIAVEAMKSLNENIDLGLGVAYQKHDARKTYTQNYDGGFVTTKGGDFDSIPVYVVGKYNFNINSEIKPYIQGNLGYSFNINESDVKSNDGTDSWTIPASVENGMYWSLGTGVEYRNYTVDLSYGVNKAKLKDNEGAKIKADYKSVTLAVGYKFNF